MTKQQGAKGQKIGRHSRGNSGKLQELRTERNRAEARREAAHVGGGDFGPKRTREELQEQKAAIEGMKRAAHRREMVERRMALRVEGQTVDAQTLTGEAVKLVLPKGVRPEDFKAAMRARVERHRRENRLGQRREGKNLLAVKEELERIAAMPESTKGDRK